MKLCWTGHPSAAMDVSDGSIDGQATLFLCTNLFVLRGMEGLLRSKDSLALYDDFVDQEESWRAQRWLCDFLDGWYLRENLSDPTRVNGVSLGSSARYLLAGILSEEMRRFLSIRAVLQSQSADMLLVHSSLGPAWNNTLSFMAERRNLPLITLSAESDEEAVTVPRFEDVESYMTDLGENLPRGILNRFSRFLLGGLAKWQDRWLDVRPTVLVVPYATTEEVWREWLERPKLRKRIRLAFSSNHRPRWGITVTSLWRSARIYDVDIESNTEEACEIANVARDTLNHLDQQEGSRKLQWEGVDLSPLFFGHFRRVVKQRFPEWARLVRAFSDSLSSNVPSLVLLPSAAPVQSRILQGLRARLGFKTVHIPHGLPGSLDREVHRVLGETLEDFDVLLSPSDVASEGYREIGGVPDDIRHVPLPAARKAQRFVCAQTDTPANGSSLATESRNVLVLDYARPHHVLAHRERTSEEYLERILSILGNDSSQKIVYKLHPGRANFEYYQRRLQQLDVVSDVELIQNNSILDVMWKAGRVIGPVSTAILEAAVLGRPYLCVHLDGFELWPPLDHPSMPVARCWKEVPRLLQELEVRWRRVRPRLLEQGCGLKPNEVRALKMCSSGTLLEALADLASDKSPQQGRGP